MAKVHVWYLLSGEIVAVGHAAGTAKCLPVSGENQNVIEAEVGDDQIASLRSTHHVDAHQKLASHS